MKQQFSTIVLGAGYAGLGYAAAHPDCLLLEESQTVGSDFHSCLRPAQTTPDAAGPLAGLMREYDVLGPQEFDSLKASLVAHEFAARQLADGHEIRLDAQLLDISGAEGGVTVRYFTNEGKHTVTARCLVDATPDCLSAPEAVRCTEKTLNVFTVCRTGGFDAALTAACPSCRIYPGYRPAERLVAFPVPVDQDIAAACRDVTQLWHCAFPNGEEKILFVAETFDATYEPVGRLPYQWIGQRTLDPLAAFMKGANQV